MAKQKSLLQRNLSNFRKLYRKQMESLAKSHRGCQQARGCGLAQKEFLSKFKELYVRNGQRDECGDDCPIFYKAITD